MAKIPIKWWWDWDRLEDWIDANNPYSMEADPMDYFGWRIKAWHSASDYYSAKIRAFNKVLFVLACIWTAIAIVLIGAAVLRLNGL